MRGLFERDYTKLTPEEEAEKEEIDSKQDIYVANNFTVFKKAISPLAYPKAIRHFVSLFPNNYMDPVALSEEATKLKNQCNRFEKLLNDTSITELDIKRFIQKNRYYHIPAAILSQYGSGYNDTALFKEFPLGTNCRADYLLLGVLSDGWKFIFVEFENPYGNITMADGNFGKEIRKGLNQIDNWKTILEANFYSVSTEFEKSTSKPLPKEFQRFDSSRMNYVVVVGRRSDFSEQIYTKRRRVEQEQNIKIFHYDNLLDYARKLIGSNTY